MSEPRSLSLERIEQLYLQYESRGFNPALCRGLNNDELFKPLASYLDVAKANPMLSFAVPLLLTGSDITLFSNTVSKLAETYTSIGDKLAICLIVTYVTLIQCERVQANEKIARGCKIRLAVLCPNRTLTMPMCCSY